MTRSVSGQTMGILGAGQLGRMLAAAAAPLGIDCRFLDPAPAPCGATLGAHVCADYQAPAALARFASGVAAVTLEFENVPTQSVEWLAQHVPVRPGARALACAQDRVAEKTLFGELGVAAGAWRSVASERELQEALTQIGTPAVLKTRRFGYDGKGQVVLRGESDVAGAWRAVGGVPCILEAFVPFQREVSIVAARGMDGQMAFYPIAENVHKNGILRQSTPLRADPMQAPAEQAVRRLAEALDYVGVLAFEFFDVGGELLANEFAPRVHNSGHWTIEGAETSQFENHVRAVMGLPLGDTALVGETRMVNVIGQALDTARLSRVAGCHVHDYAKTPRPGRKVGHVTVRAPDAATLRRRCAQAGLDALDAR